jgi:glyoxylase-like metal-dependent hydrolase (beta-lactamase superfamily II)
VAGFAWNSASIELGGYTVTALVDAEGSFATYEQAFPELAGAEFDAARGEFPELFAGRDWVLPFRAFVLQRRGTTVLVDTGVGPPTTDAAAFLPQRQGRLLDALRALDVAPAAIDVVFLTHLHVDHIGWCDAFPGAQVFAHGDDWEFFVERIHHPATAGLRKVFEQGRLELVRGQFSPAADLVGEPTPGHTPGHMSLRIGDAGMILGDVAVHPAQVVQPGLVYAGGDVDAQRAAGTRRSVLEEACREGVVVGGGHFPGTGFGRVVGRAGALAWQPAARG